MTAFLLAVHVVASIVLIGPVTVAASMFPRHARENNLAVVDVLHRISRIYAVLGLIVPVFGIAIAAKMGVLGQVWLIISMALTLLAGLLLAFVVLPGQGRIVAALHEPTVVVAAGTEGVSAAGTAGHVGAQVLARLGMATGTFALIWVVVVVLMIIRPGSTTGVGT